MITPTAGGEVPLITQLSRLPKYLAIPEYINQLLFKYKHIILIKLNYDTRAAVSKMLSIY